MTEPEDAGACLVVTDGTVTCYRCSAEQPAGTPVELVASWEGQHWYACTGCAQTVIGAAT